VRGTYLSARDPKLIVLDKVNGGKADALNCGIVAATFPYFCAVDGDSLIENEALLQVAQPVFDDPELVVATGGIVRIANGCRIDHGRVVEVGLPRARLAALQVVEYFRAFLVGRVAWSDLRALLIISGAFGLFKRSVVEEAGGYWTETVGGDAELVMRVHRRMHEQGRDYRVEFVADPVCWTEAPEDVGTLQRQRRRWQRGLVETMWRHRRVVGNPRYGALGVMAAPYFVLFELVGPVVAVLGYVLLPIAALLGLISLNLLLAFIVVAFLFGILLSVAALALEEFSFRRHARHREAGRLLLYAMADNLGYRQMTEAFQLRGLIDVLRRRTGWGEMRRVGVGR
jgi:cellulose synthase/poly-beta-1,6-N-acetylglucosamine synthase-like glycosyltransferase